MRRALLLAGLVALALALAALPVLSGNYLVRLATIAFMYVVLASSWNIIGGLAGYPSFATAAFFGLGAYGSAIVRAHAALPLALVRRRADGERIRIAGRAGNPATARTLLRGGKPGAGRGAARAHQWRHGSHRGRHGSHSARLNGTRCRCQARLYYVVMLAAAVGTRRVHHIDLAQQAWLGLALHRAERRRRRRCSASIHSPPRSPLCVAAAAPAGLAGAIYATWIGYIDPTDVFDDLLSVKPIVMAFLGGVGTIAGPVVGAVDLPGFGRIGLAQRPQLPRRHSRDHHRLSAGVRARGPAGASVTSERACARLCQDNGTVRRACGACHDERAGIVSTPVGALRRDQTFRRPGRAQRLGFTLVPGEIIGLIGPNGAGKTTLVNVITGVQHARRRRDPFQGSVSIGCRPFRSPGAASAARSRSCSRFRA